MEDVFDLITFMDEDGDTGEKTSIQFKIPTMHTIYTFHRLCKQAAAAFGYTEKSIEEVFGETMWED